MTEEQYQSLLLKLPRLDRERVEGASFWITACLLLFFVALVAQFGRGWSLALSAFVSPLLGSAYFVAWPMNPFKAFYVSESARRAVASDPSVQRLVALLESRSMKVLALRIGCIQALTLPILALAVAQLMTTVAFGFDANRDVNAMLAGIVLFTPASAGLQGAIILRVALRRLRSTTYAFE